MNKLFLTMTLVFSTMIASAQFSVLTTVSETAASTWSATEKLGVGYQVNEKLMVGITMDGEDKYEVLARYDVYKGVCIEPNYSMGLKEGDDGKREGSFNLGLSYKF